MKGAPSQAREATARGRGQCGWAQGDEGGQQEPACLTTTTYVSSMASGVGGRGSAQWHGFGLDEGPAPGPPRPTGRCSEGHKLEERRERAESGGSRPPVALGKAESLRSGLGPAALVAGVGPRRGVELLAGRVEAAGPGPGPPWGSEGCEADSGREARLKRRAGSAGPARGSAGEQGAPP